MITKLNRMRGSDKMAKLNKESVAVNPKWGDLPIVLNFKQAREVLGIGVGAMYTLTEVPGFPGRKHGGLWLISRDDLRAFIISGAGSAPKRRVRSTEGRPNLPPYQRRNQPQQ